MLRQHSADMVMQLNTLVARFVSPGRKVKGTGKGCARLHVVGTEWRDGCAGEMDGL